jgi:arsenate reductase
MAMSNRVGPKGGTSGALANWLTGPNAPRAPDARQPLVLFLCRSNRASSIMAEAILEHLAEGRLRAASAGDKPVVAQVSPCALEVLREHEVATQGLRSKPWGEFFGLGKPPVRFLITLCEVEAARVNWECDNKRLVRALWDMPDPAEVTGNEAEIRFAFEKAFATLESRIRKFLALPMERRADRGLARELELIGQEPAGFARVAPGKDSREE